MPIPTTYHEVKTHYAKRETWKENEIFIAMATSYNCQTYEKINKT